MPGISIKKGKERAPRKKPREDARPDRAKERLNLLIGSAIKRVAQTRADKMGISMTQFIVKAILNEEERQRARYRKKPPTRDEVLVHLNRDLRKWSEAYAAQKNTTLQQLVADLLVARREREKELGVDQI